MNTKVTARDLALDLCYRSPCKVGMAAVLSDSHGIFSWGWNHPSADGSSIHAERHALLRANRSRLKGSTLTVAGIRQKNSVLVFAMPCAELCMPMVRKWGVKFIEFLSQAGWQTIRL